MMETLLQWWRTREPREHILIVVALSLSLALGFYQFVWKPADAFRLNSERAFEAALVDSALVQQASRRGGTDDASATNRQPLQTVLTSSSALYGLTISRLRPAENDGMTLWLDSASPQLFYSWVSELELRHGVRVEQASIRTTPETGMVSINLYVHRPE